MPIMTFSSTVKFGNSGYSERCGRRPRSNISCGRNRPIASPAKRLILPRPAGTTPVTTLNKVDLPEPLGPDHGNHRLGGNAQFD